LERVDTLNLDTAVACYDGRVQRLPIDNKRADLCYSEINELSFSPVWVLEIQLPRSYDTLELDSLEEIMAVADPMTSDILSSVERQIEEFPVKVMSLPTVRRGNTATTSPTKDTIDLLQIIHRDLRVRRSDVETRQVLEDIEGMSYFLNWRKLSG
jgi:hypothetical protein